MACLHGRIRAIDKNVVQLGNKVVQVGDDIASVLATLALQWQTMHTLEDTLHGLAKDNECMCNNYPQIYREILLEVVAQS